jgi:DNA-binding beta-propeller fold protein YncE
MLANRPACPPHRQAGFGVRAVLDAANGIKARTGLTTVMGSTPMHRIGRAIAVLLSLLTHAAGAAEPALVLERSIRLPDVRGRIDHMAIDLDRRRLIVAELGNGSVDVVDIDDGRVVKRITGQPEPQGVAYAARGNVILVANAGDGSVRLFTADDLAQLGTVALGGDADNIRIDPRTGLAVVGYGNGGLAVIDPVTRRLLANVKLPVHPEGFQIDPATGHGFVNLPETRQIAAVDLNARTVIAYWRPTGWSANFPMALGHNGPLVTVFRSPPNLVVLDPRNGTVVQSLPVCGDADDVFVDEKRQRLYVSCGSGKIAVMGRDTSGWIRLASIKTASGARTSLFVPELDRLFVAERAGSLGPDAAIRIYRPSSVRPTGD